MLLLVILLLNGSEARINPREVVAMIEARDADDPMKHYTAEVRCVVLLSNTKEYTTREECPQIEARLRALLDKLEQEREREK